MSGKKGFRLTSTGRWQKQAARGRWYYVAASRVPTNVRDSPGENKADTDCCDATADGMTCESKYASLGKECQRFCDGHMASIPHTTNIINRVVSLENKTHNQDRMDILWAPTNTLFAKVIIRYQLTVSPDDPDIIAPNTRKALKQFRPVLERLVKVFDTGADRDMALQGVRIWFDFMVDNDLGKVKTSRVRRTMPPGLPQPSLQHVVDLSVGPCALQDPVFQTYLEEMTSTFHLLPFWQSGEMDPHACLDVDEDEEEKLENRLDAIDDLLAEDIRNLIMRQLDHADVVKMRNRISETVRKIEASQKYMTRAYAPPAIAVTWVDLSREAEHLRTGADALLDTESMDDFILDRLAGGQRANTILVDETRRIKAELVMYDSMADALNTRLDKLVVLEKTDRKRVCTNPDDPINLTPLEDVKTSAFIHMSNGLCYDVDTLIDYLKNPELGMAQINVSPYSPTMKIWETKDDYNRLTKHPQARKAKLDEYVTARSGAALGQMLGAQRLRDVARQANIMYSQGPDFIAAADQVLTSDEMKRWKEVCSDRALRYELPEVILNAEPGTIEERIKEKINSIIKPVALSTALEILSDPALQPLLKESFPGLMKYLSTCAQGKECVMVAGRALRDFVDLMARENPTLAPELLAPVSACRPGYESHGTVTSRSQNQQDLARKNRRSKNRSK